MILTTPRLKLIPATETSLEADIKGRDDLARELKVVVPDDWPPHYYDVPAIQFTLKSMQNGSGVNGWGVWYLVLDGGREIPRTVIGIAGFKGNPSTEGVVEIGYSVLEQYQRKGYASEAVAELLRWAFSHAVVTNVRAETLPNLTASIRVMEKNGFVFVGAGSEDGVVRYERTRTAPS